MKCDFCSKRPVVAMYPARDFEQRVSEHLLSPAFPEGIASEGGWFACVRCDRLLRRTDREGLLERSVEMMAKKYRIPRRYHDELRTETRRLHDSFWRNREGDRKAVGA